MPKHIKKSAHFLGSRLPNQFADVTRSGGHLHIDWLPVGAPTRQYTTVMPKKQAAACCDAQKTGSVLLAEFTSLPPSAQTTATVNSLVKKSGLPYSQNPLQRGGGQVSQGSQTTSLNAMPQAQQAATAFVNPKTPVQLPNSWAGSPQAAPREGLLAGKGGIQTATDELTGKPKQWGNSLPRLFGISLGKVAGEHSCSQESRLPKVAAWLINKPSPSVGMGLVYQPKVDPVQAMISVLKASATGPREFRAGACDWRLQNFAVDKKAPPKPTLVFGWKPDSLKLIDALKEGHKYQRTADELWHANQAAKQHEASMQGMRGDLKTEQQAHGYTRERAHKLEGWRNNPRLWTGLALGAGIPAAAYGGHKLYKYLTRKDDEKQAVWLPKVSCPQESWLPKVAANVVTDEEKKQKANAKLPAEPPAKLPEDKSSWKKRWQDLDPRAKMLAMGAASGGGVMMPIGASMGALMSPKGHKASGGMHGAGIGATADFGAGVGRWGGAAVGGLAGLPLGNPLLGTVIGFGVGNMAGAGTGTLYGNSLSKQLAGKNKQPWRREPSEKNDLGKEITDSYPDKTRTT